MTTPPPNWEDYAIAARQRAQQPQPSEHDPSDDRHDAVVRLMAENDRLHALMRSTYCAYCGYTVSLDEDGSVIAEHIRTCEKHPMREAEQKNDRLRERIAALEDALQPFTLCVGMFASCSDDWLYSDASEEYGDNAPPITVGHCRRAKEVLDGKHP